MIIEKVENCLYFISSILPEFFSKEFSLIGFSISNSIEFFFISLHSFFPHFLSFIHKSNFQINLYFAQQLISEFNQSMKIEESSSLDQRIFVKLDSMNQLNIFEYFNISTEKFPYQGPS